MNSSPENQPVDQINLMSNRGIISNGRLVGFGFCLSFAASFVLMSKVVQEDGPVVSTFLTYGITQLYFFLLRWNQIRNTAKAILSQWTLFFIMNLMTLANTLLVYIIFTHITAFTYVLVFFGTLSTSTVLAGRLIFRQGPWISSEFIIGAIALTAGILSTRQGGSQLPLAEFSPILGLTLTVIASIAGAIYLVVSKKFQEKTSTTASDIVALRFTLTTLVCFLWLISTQETIDIDVPQLGNYALIALLGSIIPLYALQKSNEVNGSFGTSSYMPFIPLFCGVFTFVFIPYALTNLDILLAVSLFLAMAVRLSHQNKVIKANTNKRDAQK